MYAAREKDVGLLKLGKLLGRHVQCLASQGHAVSQLLPLLFSHLSGGSLGEPFHGVLHPGVAMEQVDRLFPALVDVPVALLKRLRDLHHDGFEGEALGDDGELPLADGSEVLRRDRQGDARCL